MNNIVSNFDQILKFAQDYGLPLHKKKAVLREYLQTKILDLVYQEKDSFNLFFVGGSSLRLLYHLDRFSEDLDFDIVNLEDSQISHLVQNIHQRFLKENIKVDLYKNITPKRSYFEFRFKDLLYQLNLTANEEENLRIKLDFERFWQGQTRKTVLLNRYGFLINVVTIPLVQMIVQKLFAYTKRRQTLARDIYDLVWLYAQGARPERKFMETNKLAPDFIFRAKEKFIKEKKRIKNFQLKLKPFLIDENGLEKITLFPKVIDNILF